MATGKTLNKKQKLQQKKTVVKQPESSLQIAGMVASEPKISETMDLAVLSGHAWAMLVGARPEFAPQCDFSKFSAADWISVLARQPQLAMDLKYTGESFCMDNEEDFNDGLCWEDFGNDDRVRHVAKSSNIRPYGKWQYILDGDEAVITGIVERGGNDWDDKIEELKIPAQLDGYSVVGTGESAFSSYNALRRVVLSNGIKHVGQCSFSGCGKLVEVRLPNSIVEIRPQAFSRCSCLASVNLPSRLKYIGYNAFDETDLVAVTIPDNVIELDNYAFKDCIRLRKFTIGKKVKTIGCGVLDGCLSLREVKTGIKCHHLKPYPLREAKDWMFSALMRGDRIRLMDVS